MLSYIKRGSLKCNSIRDLYNPVKYRHSRNNRLCRFYITGDTYFTDEVEDYLYLFGIPELRSKKALIETFIAGINEVDDIMAEWHEYVVAMREEDLKSIIKEEKLKPEETRKYLENAFRDGEIKTAGTDIDKLMPPVSRFGGGKRLKRNKAL